MLRKDSSVTSLWGALLRPRVVNGHIHILAMTLKRTYRNTLPERHALMHVVETVSRADGRSTGRGGRSGRGPFNGKLGIVSKEMDRPIRACMEEALDD